MDSSSNKRLALYGNPRESLDSARSPRALEPAPRATLALRDLDQSTLGRTLFYELLEAAEESGSEVRIIWSELSERCTDIALDRLPEELRAWSAQIVAAKRAPITECAWLHAAWQEVPNEAWVLAYGPHLPSSFRPRLSVAVAAQVCSSTGANTASSLDLIVYGRHQGLASYLWQALSA